jgi:hypothetical protein
MMTKKNEGASNLARGGRGDRPEKAPSKPANSSHEGMTIGGWVRLGARAHPCQVVPLDNMRLPKPSIWRALRFLARDQQTHVQEGRALASGRLKRTTAPFPAWFSAQILPP